MIGSVCCGVCTEVATPCTPAGAAIVDFAAIVLVHMQVRERGRERCKLDDGQLFCAESGVSLSGTKLVRG